MITFIITLIIVAMTVIIFNTTIYLRIRCLFILEFAFDMAGHVWFNKRHRVGGGVEQRQ